MGSGEVAIQTTTVLFPSFPGPAHSNPSSPIKPFSNPHLECGFIYHVVSVSLECTSTGQTNVYGDPDRYTQSVLKGKENGLGDEAREGRKEASDPVP